MEVFNSLGGPSKLFDGINLGRREMLFSEGSCSLFASHYHPEYPRVGEVKAVTGFPNEMRPDDLTSKPNSSWRFRKVPLTVCWRESCENQEGGY